MPGCETPLADDTLRMQARPRASPSLGPQLHIYDRVRRILRRMGSRQRHRNFAEPTGSKQTPQNWAAEARQPSADQGLAYGHTYSATTDRNYSSEIHQAGIYYRMMLVQIVGTLHSRPGKKRHCQILEAEEEKNYSCHPISEAAQEKAVVVAVERLLARGN